MTKNPDEEEAELKENPEGIEMGDPAAAKEQEKQQRYAILREVLEIFLGKRASEYHFFPPFQN